MTSDVVGYFDLLGYPYCLRCGISGDKVIGAGDTDAKRACTRCKAILDGSPHPPGPRAVQLAKAVLRLLKPDTSPAAVLAKRMCRAVLEEAE